ncbi:MAG TPA: SCP2 sterol-binding domain-containing protein [Telluria sp.]|jgi:ubiquinone biosynthesis protein UbiJ
MPTLNSFDPQSTLMTPAVAAINHLLAQEAWARDALAMHAGKVACIDAGAIVLRLRVSVDGMVETGAAEEAANVTIRVKLADLPLIAQNRERAFSYVKIEGDAEFANTISQLSKGLRWEAEHDLERFLGPIAATRLVGGARSVLGAAVAGQQKLAENIAEYFLEEKPLLIRPEAVDDFATEVNRLRDDLERTAKRIARLEAKLAQQGAAPDTTSRIAGQQDLDL